MAAWSTVPTLNIATQAIAGLAMRLVHRLEVRQEPINPSPAAANVAAAGPCSSNSRKMKISPAAKEFFERGTRTGKKPASMAMPAPTATCNKSPRGSASKVLSV